MISLRKMAEDEVVFRFESDEDSREFWDLYVKNDGNMDGNRSLSVLRKHKTWNLWIYKEYYKITFNAYSDERNIPSWTEIKERYREKLNVDINEVVENSIRIMKNVEIENARKLLELYGYKVEAPYQEPTDEEIIERIKFENEKAPQSDIELNCYIYKKHGDYNMWNSREYKILGVIYTTQSIADKLVAELNEKRFERV